jgi:RNA polymerase sigma-70 factor (ECF subfamily)
MTKIGINTALMLLRKRRSSRQIASELFADDVQRFESPECRDPGLNPEQRYMANQTLNKLRNAMQRLPANTRTLMDLYCVKELRLKEAAAILGISEGTAKSRILRGRRRLHRSLNTKRIAMAAASA